jgi:hypothetical protein
MILTREQLSSTELKCVRCGKTSSAIHFKKQKRKDRYFVYKYCNACQHAKNKVEVFEPTEPAQQGDLYSSTQPRRQFHGICQHRKDFTHGIYQETHRRVQAKLKFITEHGLSLDKVEDVPFIDALLKKHGMEDVRARDEDTAW